MLNISLDKLLLALKSLVCLVERHTETSLQKVLAAKAAFFKHWLSLSEEQKLAAFKDQRLYQNACKEISALGCPTNQSEIESIASELHKIASNSLEAAHDYIKLRMKVLPKGGEGAQQFEKLAIQAITNDQ